MKKWYESKAIWLGAALVAIAIIDTMEAGGDWKSAVMAGFGTAGMIVRHLTREAITK